MSPRKKAPAPLPPTDPAAQELVDEAQRCLRSRRQPGGRERADALMLRAAALGHVDALCHAADLYRQRKNLTKSFRFALEVARRGQYMPLVQKAWDLLYGRGAWARNLNGRSGRRGSNPNLGLRWLEAAARVGVTGVMLHLVEVYEEGGPIPNDSRRAIALLRRLVRRDDPDGWLSLGRRYYYGMGVRGDARKAVLHYKKAAQLGSPIAYSNLGLCYRDGEDVRKDLKRSFECMRKAATLDNTSAMVRVATAHLEGLGVRRNRKRGLELLKRFARYTWKADRELARRRLRGLDVPRNVHSALRVLRQRVAAKDTAAMLILGDWYHDREHRPDYRRAIDLYRRAARLRDTEAMVNLHDCFEDGHPGVLRKNDATARAWLQKAWDFDEREAVFRAGERLVLGRGFPRNRRHGMRLLRTAANRGVGAATEVLGNAYLSGRRSRRSVEQALRWFREAARHDWAEESEPKIRECRRLLRSLRQD